MKINDLMLRFLDFLDTVDTDEFYPDEKCNDMLADLHEVLLKHRNRMNV